jgi:hypothetical protein
MTIAEGDNLTASATLAARDTSGTCAAAGYIYKDLPIVAANNVDHK